MSTTTDTIRLPDQAARDRIRGTDPADLDRCFAVEAGAGSGKTTALIGRLLALVEAGEEHLPGGLGEVVAITFTRKAAAELRAQAYRRFAGRAAELTSAHEETSGDERVDVARRLDRVRSALGALDAACLDTIHGFCGRLLRADALAVGLPPDFAVVEDREADDLRRAFWQRYVQGQHERGGGVPLEDVGMSPPDVEPLFEALIRHADRLPAPYGATCPEMASAVGKAVERLRSWQALRPSPRSAPATAFRPRSTRPSGCSTSAGSIRRSTRPDSSRRCSGGTARAAGRGSVTLNRWAASGTPEYALAKALRDEEVPALAAAVLPVVREWQAYQYDAALAYARGAVAAFAEERRREGTLTFDDVLQLTADLLRRSPAARRRAAARYRRFFVDEFQDTDPVQAEVLFLLAAEDLAETDWRRCRPRPGSLFLVGDPKQSIYRFRRADIETYDEARRMLGEAAQLQLSASFRSLPGVCAWVNAQLRGPFGDDRSEEGGERRQAAWVDLRSARPAGPSNRAAAPAVARLDVEKVYRNAPDGIAEAEAEAVASFVRAAVDGRADAALYERSDDEARPEAFEGDKGTVFGPEARYGDFLVLCRAATRFSVYTEAFERYGIPYALAGDKGLGRADELRALVDLLDAVRDPLDEVVRAAHRAGLLGGLDAPTLYGLHVTTLDGDERRRRAAEAADAQVAMAREALATLPLSAALEHIVTESGLLAWSAVQPRGSERAGGVLKLIDHARRWEADGLHWTEALEHLRDLVDGTSVDGRVTLEEGARDAVRVMTVHQAKGLQAPVVFLADPYSPQSYAPSEHAGRDEAGRPYATVPLVRTYAHGGSSFVAAPSCWHERDAEEAALYEAAEARRVLYVAATRAQGLLVVSRYGEKAGEGPWGPLHGGLDAGALPLGSLLTGAAEAPDRPHYPLDSLSERRRVALARAARPSYRSVAVTDVGTGPTGGIAGLGGEDEEAAGYGSDYGTAVHRLFEWAVRHRHAPPDAETDRACTEALWAEHDVRGSRPEQGFEALAALRTSALWERLLAADTVHVEVPVGGPLDGRGAVRGTVDLAYCREGSWHLVDYKTDGDAVGDAVTGCAARHTEQLATYAALWEAATGAAPASRSVWFTASGSLCEV